MGAARTNQSQIEIISHQIGPHTSCGSGKNEAESDQNCAPIKRDHVRSVGAIRTQQSDPHCTASDKITYDLSEQ